VDERTREGFRAGADRAIGHYNDAWNAHDLDAIVAMHAPDMVFANHTAGESASGEDVRAHIGSIFETWPDIEFTTRRLYVREGLVVQEWTAVATHAKTMRRGDLAAEPTGSSGTGWT
jgi:ketosteroid isomerase-like protein